MTRSSKREMILEAIANLVEESGIASLTFDAVSEKSGVKRGGLLYHFPSREAMLMATHEYMAGQWEAELATALGKSADEATQAERAWAYVKVSERPGSRSELLLLLESGVDEAFARPWRRVYERWAPPLPTEGDPASLMTFIARLASDGLWMSDATSNQKLSKAVRKQINRELLALLQRAGAADDQSSG